jgi:hypothetical protein
MSRDANHQSSIEMRAGIAWLARVSPSQIKTFKDCPRKWWYDKRAKLTRKPPGKGQVLGSQCHARIEHYLITGEDGRGRHELSGRDLLAPFVSFAPFNYRDEVLYVHPGRVDALDELAQAMAPLKVESSIGDLKTPGGTVFVGYADLLLAPGYVAFEGSPHAWVIDHKFKKDLDAYADTEKDLETDAQAVIYSAAVLGFWPQTDRVRFVHHNHQTQGQPRAFHTGVVMDRDLILDRMVDLCNTVDRDMQAAAKATKDLDVPHNEKSCDKFGGCDFVTTCPHSPKNRLMRKIIPGVTRPGIELKEEGTSMGLVEAAMAAMNAGTANTPAPVQAAPVTPPVTAPVQPVAAQAAFCMAAQAVIGNIYTLSTQGLGQMAGAMGGAVVFKSPAGALIQTPADQIIMDVTHDPVSRAAFGMAGVLPPAPAAQVATPAKERRMLIIDAPAPGTTQGAGAAVNPPDATAPAANPEQAELIRAAQQALILAAQGQALTTAPGAQVAATITTAPAAQAEAPAPKKRGRPAKVKPGSPEAVATGAAQAESLSGLVLIVNAAVTGQAVTDLSGYVADLADAIAEAGGAADPRLCDPKGPFGYGAWKGAMRAAALKSPPNGICSIQRGDLADPIIEALSEIATLVVRG